MVTLIKISLDKANPYACLFSKIIQDIVATNI